ncbi:MAG: cobalamin-binding protein, partial [Firmicutes bacterium]|nr:cobalamin-binding protein [Bacillota bacterium]
MVDLKVLTEAMGALGEEKVMSLLRDFLATNPTAGDAQQVVNACQQGMAIVGDLFEQGEYFVGDLIFAGELLTNAIEILKPVIGQESSEKIGKIVLGTVHG